MSIYETSITNPKKQLEFYKQLSEHLQQENQQLKKENKHLKKELYALEISEEQWLDETLGSDE